MTKINSFLSILLCLALSACAAAPEDEMGPPVMPPATGGTGGTVTPPPVDTNDPRWAKAGDEHTMLINGDPRFCKNQTALLVGDCNVEMGDNGQPITWTNGRTVTRNAEGWYPLKLSGAPGECHVTPKECGNEPIIQPDNTLCGGTWWSAGCQGQPSAPGTHKGGGYAWCGNYLGGPYTCNIAFRHHPGALPDMFGSNPPTGP